MASALQDLFGVQNLVSVVTGGGTGIGLYAAKALDAHGAKAVYIVGRRRDKLEAAAKEAKNGTLIPLVGDASSQSDLGAMVERVKAPQGYVNVVFANAGIAGPRIVDKLPKDRQATVQEFRSAAFEQTSIEEFDEAFRLNLAAPFYLAVAFLELLDAGNKKGNLYQKSQVIVTASIGGLTRPPFAGWAYQMSEAGAIHLVKMMSTYFGPWKIRANCIAPGLFPSEATQGVLESAKTGLSVTAEGGMPASLVPLERTGTEEDMAGAVLFLMSKAGAYLNGNTLVTDGGRLGQVASTY